LQSAQHRGQTHCLGERRRYLSDAAAERRLQARQRPAVINRTQRLGTSRGSDRHEAVAIGAVQQLAEKLRRHARHVASQNQVPLGAGMMQCGQDPAQRPLAWIPVRNCPETLEAIRPAYQHDASRRRLHLAGNRRHQRPSTIRQQRFVPSHAGTLAAHEHVPGPADHTEMIPLTFSPAALGLPYPRPKPKTLVVRGEVANILTRFCFILFLVASLGAAAENLQPRRVTSVVRPDLRTGKLVRSVVVAPKPVAEQKVSETLVTARVVEPGSPEPASTPAPTGIDEAVEQIAAQNGLSAQLLHSVIKVESNYNPLAVSSKGALGLMQLIPSTAARFGVSDVFNPIDNIQGGAKYLRYLLDLYGGSYPLALAAYNAGEAAVARHGGIPPYRETVNYVVQVRKQFEKAQKAAPAKPAKAEAKPRSEEAKPAGSAHIVEIVEPDGSVRYVSR
jgi:hypothetical protein